MPALKSTSIVGRRDLYMLNPEEIVVTEGFNPREKGNVGWSESAIQDLMDSIQQHGVLEPVRVYRNGDRFELISGHRRLHCCLLLIEQGVSIKSIPAIVESNRLSEAERLRNALIANDGIGLTPLEEARAYNRFLSFGWTQKEIATQLGRSIGHISSRLLLLDSVPEVQEALSNGNITTSEAVALIRETKDQPDHIQKGSLETTIAAKAKKRATKHTLSPEQKRENKLHDTIFALLDAHGVPALLEVILTYSTLEEITEWCHERVSQEIEKA